MGKEIIEKAYLAGGCFWCLEASYKLLPGVIRVTTGYAGGTVENPAYDQVCKGTTGHAEVVEVEFDPLVINYFEILNIFFKVHDPSQKNRQGSDVGTQYRSAIFYTNEEQKRLAEDYIKNLHNAGEYDTVYTELNKLERFWPAEEYHQEYFEKHPNEAYCQIVIKPKVDKIAVYLEK